MAPVKRNRVQAEAEVSEPKKVKLDPIAEKVELIKSTLSDPNCPVEGGDSHRRMLLASVPHTLTVTIDERHQYQTEVIKMVEVVLDAYVAEQEVKFEDAKAKVDSAEREAKQAMKNLEESASRVQAQEEEVEKCQEALRVDSEAVKAAEETLKIASKEVEDFDANLQGIVDEKQSFSSVYNECFLILKSAEAEVDKKGATQLLKKLESALKKLKTEDSLLNAISPALKKPSTERGPFDFMAIEGVEALLTKQMETLQEKIDSADVAKSEQVAAQGAAKESLEAVKGKKEASEQASKEAKESLSDLEAKHQETYKGCDSFSRSTMEASTEHDKREASLKKAKQVLTTFKELLERKTEAPPSIDKSMEVVDTLEPACVQAH